jgi:hypothetical protein
VIFAPAYSAPVFAAAPTVLTIHDVSFFAHPEWFGRREGQRRRLDLPAGGGQCRDGAHRLGLLAGRDRRPRRRRAGRASESRPSA